MNRSICLVALLFGACTDDVPKDTIPIELVSVFPDSIESVTTDHYRINSGQMYGDQLVIEVVTRGCPGHELSMAWDGTVVTSYPTQVDLGLVVNDHNRECQASLTERLIIDVSQRKLDRPIYFNVTPENHDFDDPSNLQVLWDD
jgi:hypothetical protein